MKYTYKTQGTCSREIELEMKGGKIADIRFTGGCHGNLQGLSALVKGQSPEEVITKLRGIKCGNKETSCPDQLARALEEMLAQ